MELEEQIFPNVELHKPFLIAGPCSAETYEQTLQTARELHEEGVQVFRAGLWKPRTKPGCFEGVGARGLAWLEQVRQQTGMLVATEVATAQHVEQVMKSKVDILWVGARTTSNPFAMQELADALSGCDVTVLVKNPISPDVELWIGALERLYNAGIHRLGAIHRGFPSIDKGRYRNLPMWSLPIELRRRLPYLPLLTDPSHMGGRRDLIQSLSQQALDLDFDGLVIESHTSPDDAWSDAQQQITPRVLGEIMRSLVLRRMSSVKQPLVKMRSEIDELDDRLLDILARRMEVSEKIGAYKQTMNMPVLQTDRYEELLSKRRDQAIELGLEPDFIQSLLRLVHEESVRLQMNLLEKKSK